MDSVSDHVFHTDKFKKPSYLSNAATSCGKLSKASLNLHTKLNDEQIVFTELSKVIRTNKEKEIALDD